MRNNLKISRLWLNDIRGFESLDIDFCSASGPRDWATFLGDNGSGKSTTLKSIALALGDRSHAAGLLQDFNGSLVRKGASDQIGNIRVEFVSADLRHPCAIHIDVKAHENREEIIGYRLEPEDFPWDRLFACGYGAGRGVEGTESWSKYRVSDAVYSLFEYSQPLQNAELMLLRISEDKQTRQQLLDVIAEVLMLEAGSIRLSRRGIEFQGPWGEDLPLRDLGDGYRATFSWITDVLGWAMLKESDAPKPANLTGIILIDELDQHLHPVWQRRVIQLLRNNFPRMQFFATTHSPILTLGTTDLDDEVCEVYSLNFNEEKRAVEMESGVPRGQRIDQILTSPLFGLRSVSDDETAAQILRLADLGRLPKTEARNNERKNLIQELGSRVGAQSAGMQEIARRALNKVLEDALDHALSEDAEAVKLELSRQLDRLARPEEP